MHNKTEIEWNDYISRIVLDKSAKAEGERRMRYRTKQKADIDGRIGLGCLHI